MHALLSKWSPPLERSRLSSFVYSGAYVGTVIAFPISGVVSSNPKLGWPVIFYLFGALGVIWFIFWIFLAFDSPEKNPFISNEVNNLFVYNF